MAIHYFQLWFNCKSDMRISTARKYTVLLSKQNLTIICQVINGFYLSTAPMETASSHSTGEQHNLKIEINQCD